MEYVPTVHSLHVPLPPDAPAGIYVHIPFCKYICPYCDFNVYAGQEDLIPDYVSALLEEMRLTRDAHPSSAEAPTLFIGGGTPSLLPATEIARIVDGARRILNLAPDAEVTMESNPEPLDRAYLSDVRAAGVNRLSLGVQSRQKAGLKVLGRAHRAYQSDEAFRAAREAGFDNISLDFIFGWPGQTVDDWRDDLQTILQWEPEHVSLYSLIVEPGTPMERAVERGILQPVDDDGAANLYELAVEMLGEAGWEHYEIANWAREPGLRSHHNQLYWQNGEYFGIGAGAHGHLAGRRASNIRLPGRYIDAVHAGELPSATTEQIDPETAMGETMMLGLRLLIDGVSPADFEARHGLPLRQHYGQTIDRFVELRLLQWSGERLRLTPHGMLLSNDVCAEFLPSRAINNPDSGGTRHSQRAS